MRPTVQCMMHSLTDLTYSPERCIGWKIRKYTLETFYAFILYSLLAKTNIAMSPGTPPPGESKFTCPSSPLHTNKSKCYSGNILKSSKSLQYDFRVCCIFDLARSLCWLFHKAVLESSSRDLVQRSVCAAQVETGFSDADGGLCW